MKKNTKLALLAVGVGALAYYMYKKSKTSTTVGYAGTVGKRLGFADGGYVNKGDLYNNNMRYGMTGQQTFFSKEQEPSKLLK